MKKNNQIFLSTLLIFCTLVFAQEPVAPVSSVQDSTAMNPMEISAQDTAESDSLLTEPVLIDSTRIDSLLEQKKAVIDSSELPVVVPVIQAFIADTAMYRGLDYGTFADVFDWLPGTYNVSKGTVGDHDKGAMFAGIPGEFDLMYGFLNMNDPLTGLADMNNIQVEGVGSVRQDLSHAQQDYGYTNLGQTLRVTPLNIAALPPRSIVTYRTGNSSYTDVDVRLGLRASDKTIINMGGIIKQYVGLQDYNRYNGQKVSLQVKRQYTRKLNLEYIYLQNKSELDVPILQYIDTVDFSRPHETIRRSDHGLAVRYGRLLNTTLQYTSYQNDYYEKSLSLYSYYSSHKTKSYRLTTQIRKRLAGLEWQAGFAYIYDDLSSKDWGDHQQKRIDGWAQASFDRKFFSASAGLKSNYFETPGKDYVSPEVSLAWQPMQDLKTFAFANRFVRSPSFSALYNSGPFFQGNELLENTEYGQAGGGAEFNLFGVNAWICATGLNIHNQVAVYADKDTALAINQIDHDRFSVDASLGYEWKYGFSGHAKGKFLWVASEDAYFDITNYPAGYGKGYIQYHNIFFKKDLDLTVRLGGAFIGEMFTPEYYYTQYPLSEWITDPIVVPYVHVLMKIRTMTIFLSYQNPLDMEYQRQFLYPMPQSELRWGFNWMFFD